MKSFFYSLILFFVWGIQVNATPPIDSLRYVVNKQVGVEKLRTLWGIVSHTDISQRASVINELENEAIKQSNNLFLAIAYEHRATYFLHIGKSDSLVFFAEQGLDALNKVDKRHINSEANKQLLVNVNYICNDILVKHYIRLNQLYLALNVVERMLEKSKREKNEIIEADAYLMMAMVRLVLHEPEEGLKNLDRSLKLTERRTVDKLMMKQEFYKQLKEYDLILELTDSLEFFIEHAPFINADYIKIPTYYNSAYAHTQLNSLSEARKYIDRVSDLLFQNNDNVSPYILKMDYYIASNNNVKALQQVDKALQEVDKALANNINYPHVNILSIKKTKSTILRNLDRNDEAYDLLHEVSEQEQENSKLHSSALVSELETLHRVDNLKHDLTIKEAELQSFRLVIGGAFLITILVIVMIMVQWRANKNLKERNLDLYKRHKKIEEVNKEIENIKQQSDLLDADDIIMNKLDSYMKEYKAYLDSEITRDTLALEMGTNRQYLIAAIKEKRNKTFNEYIYLWRLKYAYDLIIHNKDEAISEIFLKSGFASRRVFNREFKKMYAMTPIELRTAAQEEEKL